MFLSFKQFSFSFFSFDADRTMLPRRYTEKRKHWKSIQTVIKGNIRFSRGNISSFVRSYGQVNFTSKVRIRSFFLPRCMEGRLPSSLLYFVKSSLWIMRCHKQCGYRHFWRRWKKEEAMTTFTFTVWENCIPWNGDIRHRALFWKRIDLMQLITEKDYSKNIKHAYAHAHTHRHRQVFIFLMLH